MPHVPFLHHECYEGPQPCGHVDEDGWLHLTCGSPLAEEGYVVAAQCCTSAGGANRTLILNLWLPGCCGLQAAKFDLVAPAPSSSSAAHVPLTLADPVVCGYPRLHCGECGGEMQAFDFFLLEKPRQLGVWLSCRDCSGRAIVRFPVEPGLKVSTHVHEAGIYFDAA
jgi:hypothetical protein